jgi:nucleotide-binding universal stress UspA family protein
VVRPYHPFPGLAPDDPAGFRREVERIQRERRQAGLELVEQARARLDVAGKRATATVAEGDPAAEVLKMATAMEADLIVAGARGVSLIQGLLIGSLADRLLKTARCSILLVR